MSYKQKIALISPLILICMMYPVFHFLSRILGNILGWYFGLVVYWLIWGATFSWLLIGKESLKRMIRPQKPNGKVILLLLFLWLMAGLYRFVPGMGYEKPDIWIFILLLSTNFGNGFFEEVLWRGVYMKLFPDSILFRIVWSSIWFGLWHYVPGSVSSNGNTMGLIIGSCLMGFYLSFMAKKTGTIWWNIVAHTVGGFIMIV